MLRGVLHGVPRRTVSTLRVAPHVVRPLHRRIWHVARDAPRYNPAVTTSALPAEPETAVRTIADLPFHVLGRFQKPMAMGRVRAGQVEGISSKELFESVRDVFESYARYWGWQIGVKYGQAFLSTAPLRIEDPLSLVREVVPRP